MADVPQRFVPDLNARFAVGAAGELPDRHRVLEAAWLRSSPELLSDGSGTRDFLHVVTPGGTEAPALFMVAMDADTGRRWIASDVCVDANLFKDAVDTLSQTRRRKPKEDEHGVGPECPVTPDSERPALLRLPAITAAGLSARFPWVSPRGRMPNGSGLLDGGMFELTGAETAAEILRALNSWCEPADTHGVVLCHLWRNGTVHKQLKKEDMTPSRPVYVRLLALQLVNDPIEGPDTSPKPGLRLALPELLGPVLALNSSRSARGVAAWASLEGDHALFAGADGPEEHLTARVEVAPEHTAGGVPLTWTLSEGSRERMTGRLECVVGRRCAQDPGKDEEADRLRDWLDRWFPKAPAPSASDSGAG